jgi:ABC-type multidrug transport system fused ATPase/permease subunit
MGARSRPAASVRPSGGYETVLDDGSDVSIGERQRITIARLYAAQSGRVMAAVG